MKYSPFFQNKMKLPQKFKYNTNFIHQSNNQNIFGIKQNRDITPFRKYNQMKKTKSNNNLIKKKQNNKKINIEGDLFSSSNLKMKRAKTPLNKSAKDFSSNNFLMGKTNINSISLNNSIKLNKPKIKPPQKSNRFFQNVKLGIGFNNNFNNFNSKSLNKSYNLSKVNRTVTPKDKFNLSKSSNFIGLKSLKLNRSTTPNPKSKTKFGLSKSNSKPNFGSNININYNNYNLKQHKFGNKSPNITLKKKNILQSNSISNKLLYPKNNVNSHYSNKFKSKNIFAINNIHKNKPKVITINMNINQNYLSSSSKSNLNDISQNKDSTRTEQSRYSENNSIFINQGISNNNSRHNLNFSNQNNFNEIAQIESNNSIIISGIKTDNNINYKDGNYYGFNNNIKNNSNYINNSNEIEKNTSQEIRKKILCMHEFSKTGYAGEDEKKINQDNYFVFRNFVNNVNYIFMAVCDGHGTVGQEISNYLKENLPIDLNHALRDAKVDILKDDISSIITDVFVQENTKLISNEMINSMLSGSTCVSTIYTPIKLITANVGDSRIILGKFFPNLQEWKSMDLTRDHKPALPDEEKRILEKGGRIEPMKDEDNTFIGPPRVWLKKQDYPGLAMSRSFGDRVAHSVGVSEKPEIKEYKFCKEDKFFVVASDGLFEFISSQDIVNIIKDYYLSGDIVGCCEYLYELSREKWIKEEEVVDDITMILVFLEDE